jgi:hypothetical protein
MKYLLVITSIFFITCQKENINYDTWKTEIYFDGISDVICQDTIIKDTTIDFSDMGSIKFRKNGTCIKEGLYFLGGQNNGYWNSTSSTLNLCFSQDSLYHTFKLYETDFYKKNIK